MAVKLNLLPENYALKGPLAQFVKIARPLTVILLALFLTMIVGMGGFFIFSSISLSNLNTANLNLENQIQAQSSAQQQIVLLKDRLTQIKAVQALPTASKNLSNIGPVISLISGNSLLSELDVDTKKTSASIIFKSNLDLTNFFRSLDANKTYTTVTLGAFDFSPVSGYQLSLSFSGQ